MSSRRRWARFAVRVLVAVAAVVALVGGGAFVWWRGSGKPQRDGRAEIAGLGQRCTVRFDAFGVPHVNAASARDLACALGWLHANDRIGQMELARRYAAGRLSELVGERALGTDRRMRTLGLRRAAERCVESLEPESRAILDAYCAGVNAWLAAHGSDLPPDLVLLRAEPEPWTPADSLSVIGSMWQMLAYSKWRDEARLDALVVLGPELTRDLIGEPGYEFDTGVLEIAMQARDTRETELAAARERATAAADGQGGGSNNWAVAAERTADGHALVANDPHLGLEIPGIWYEAQLRAPDYEAAGVTLPGMPMIVIGQGSECAWGFTNTELDVCDVLVERGDLPRAVERDGALVPTSRTVETIRVRGGDDVEHEVYATDVGPLLEARGTMPARSLRWAAYTPSDPVAPFLGLARARNRADVEAAAARYVGPSQNLVCATRADGLFFTVFGWIPEREGYDGRFPAPAWEGRAHWRGWRDPALNPRIAAPASGLLASANDDVRPDGYGLPYPGDFAEPFRVQRIRELVGVRSDWTVESLADCQLDLVSNFALETLQSCRDVAGGFEGEAAVAWSSLEPWDGAMDASGAPALFLHFAEVLEWNVFADEFRRESSSPDLDAFGSKRLLLAALRGELAHDWIDDVLTPARETKGEIVGQALAGAWKACAARWGDDPARWRYGEVHTWRPAHALAETPLLGRYFARGPFEVPGSATTIRVFAGGWNGASVSVVHGASVRIVADVDDPDRSRIVLPVGQSGHPFDAHFDDQLALYLAGEMRRVAWSEAAIEAATVSRLELAP